LSEPYLLDLLRDREGSPPLQKPLERVRGLGWERLAKGIDWFGLELGWLKMFQKVMGFEYWKALPRRNRQAKVIE
jgi:hypothetical protein